MEQCNQDIASLQDKIRLLNNYGVHVLFNGSNLDVDCQAQNENRGIPKGSVESDKINVSNFTKEQLQSAQVSFLSEPDNDVKSTGCSVQNTNKFKTNNKDFTLKPGLNICLGGNGPIDYFRLIGNEKMFKNMLEETNKNLHDMREENGCDNTQDTTMYELIRFIGLLLHMGTIQLNRIVDYWSSDPLMSFSCFSRYMTRNRFMILLKCFQYSNLIDHFNEVMSKCYTAGREMTAKEPLYYIEGRLRKKPSVLPRDNVITFHSISEPNGVVLRCAVSSSNMSINILSDLLNDLSNGNRSIYVANCYSSVRLAQKILKQSITCTGFLPNDTLKLAMMFQDKPLIGIIQEGCFIGRWKKDSSVFFSSEYSENESIDEDSIPKAIVEFNRLMNDDKLSDELLAYYTCERRQMSADKKILIHLIQIILMNAYYIYINDNETNESTLYDFRLDIIRSLLDPEIKKWTTDQDSTLGHRPCLLHQDSLGRQRRKKCNMCFYQKGIRQDTQYFCPRCPDSPGLCLDTCFRTYHIFIAHSNN